MGAFFVTITGCIKSTIATLLNIFPTLQKVDLSIDESLTGNKHLSHGNSKISRAIFSIDHVKHLLTYDSLRTFIYFALDFIFHFSFGILARGNGNHSIVNETFTVQKRAIRIVNKSGYNDHTDPLFKRDLVF